MKHIIVTGHSKGLGAGICKALLMENNHIHGISRSDNDELRKLALAAGAEYSFYQGDLSRTETISTVMIQVFLNLEKDISVDGIYLINNAGVIDPIGTIETLDASEIDAHFRINLHAPVLLTHEFINRSASYKVEKRVLNISSGAAVSPYHGWSIYCTGKAALDMFTRCVGTEQESVSWPVEVMSIAPGIIDTEMQTTIRNTPDGKFIHKQKFIELKESGQLVRPETAGMKITELLFSDKFENGGITDIRHQY